MYIDYNRVVILVNMECVMDLEKFNDAVKLSHGLSTIQHKAFNFVLHDLRKQFQTELESDNRVFKIDCNELTTSDKPDAHTLNNIKKNFDEISSIVVRTMSKDGNIHRAISVFEVTEYQLGKRYYEVLLTPSFVELCKEYHSRGGFLSLPKEEQKYLGSNYSLKIWEHLKVYAEVGRTETSETILWLRNWLEIGENQYSRYNNFKYSVLDRAQKEIHSETTLRYEMESIKEGTKVVGIKFYNIKHKAKKKLTEANKVKKVGGSRSNEFNELLAYGIDSDKSEEYSKKYPIIEFIKESISKTDKQKNVGDKPSYLLGILDKEWDQYQERLVELKKRKASEPKSAGEKIADNKKREEAKRKEIKKCLGIYRKLSKQEQDKRMKLYKKEKESEGDTFFYKPVIEETLAREYCEEIGAIQSSVEQTVLDM
jgi:plasmid replication initiation protein